MNYFKFFIKYSIGILFIVLAACNAENAEVNSSAANNKQTDKTLAKQPHYIGKPHAPIVMRYKASVKNTITVGQQISYKIYFSTSINASDLQVRYTTKADLLIQNPSMSIAFGEQVKGKKNLLELNIIPQQDGLFYIYLSATLDINGQKQSRNFVIPVQVGEQLIEKTLLKKSSSQGEVKQKPEPARIISMPAIETTR